MHETINAEIRQHTRQGPQQLAFRPVADCGAVLAAASALGLRLLLEARRSAYDGKGNITARALRANRRRK